MRKDWLLVRATLLAKGYTISQLAREIGVSPSMVWRVLRGERKSKRIETALKKRLGNDFICMVKRLDFSSQKDYTKVT